MNILELKEKLRNYKSYIRHSVHRDLKINVKGSKQMRRI